MTVPVRGHRVAAVVITHGPHPDLEQAIASLVPQVDELVVIDNLPGPQPRLPEGAVSIVNRRQAGFAANANKGVAATTAPIVVLSNADAIARPGAVATLADFLLEHPRCGVAGPQIRYPDGSWQASRRRFPTVWKTFVRRTPLRFVMPNHRFQRSHYLLDERPLEPVETDWMIGGFLLLRREMLEEIGGFDEAFRLYGEEIDLCYRAAKAGWERWYVPDALVQHRLAAVIDHRFLTRRTIWHLKGMIRFVRKHPEYLSPRGSHVEGVATVSAYTGPMPSRPLRTTRTRRRTPWHYVVDRRRTKRPLPEPAHHRTTVTSRPAPTPTTRRAGAPVAAPAGRRGDC